LNKEGNSCSELTLNIEALQKIITEQGELIEKYKKERLESVWRRIFG
jgi:hypothetical protein